MTDNMKERVNYVPSGPVKNPKDFFGRQSAINEFFDTVNDSNMFAPRRIMGVSRAGKTSFLNYISNEDVFDSILLPETKPTKVIHLHAKEVDTPKSFFIALSVRILERLPETDRNEITKSYSGDISDMDTWLKKCLKKYRIVVLLDAFDFLLHSPGFDATFFNNLRAFINEDFIWIVSMKTLGQLRDYTPNGTGAASYFLNSFYQKPIILGPLNDREVEELIVCPAASQGVVFPEAHVAAIRNLAGDMPYFLQNIAQAWLSNFKRNYHNPDDITLNITNELLHQLSGVRNQIEKYWKSFSEKEKHFLYTAAKDQLPLSSELDDDVQQLITYGFLTRTNTNLTISGNLFRHWLLRHSGFESFIRQNNPKRTTTDGLSSPVSGITIFISYSHKNSIYKESILKYMYAIMQKDLIIEEWNDQYIQAGTNWKESIFEAIDRAKIAILLISTDFLVSEFIMKEELPAILEKEKSGNLRVYPIYCETLPIELVNWLENRQYRPAGKEGLFSIAKRKRTNALVEITRELVEIAKNIS